MKRLLLSLLLLPCLAWGYGNDKSFEFKDWHCGVDGYHSPITIDDCFVQDANNVYFDKQAAAEKRAGYTVAFSSKSYAYMGAWSYTDASNNIWMIVRSSDSIIATTGAGTNTFNVLIATTAPTSTVNAVAAFGNIYFADPVRGLYDWNGATTVFISSAPKGSVIAAFHNRIWIAGLGPPQGGFIYGSGYLDGSNWTTGPLATDAVVFQVSLQNNADSITALFGGFNDTLHIFKNYSILGLYGFDQTDFQIRELNAEVGCIDGRSIQAIFGGIVFVSARGVEFFDGYTSNKISDPVKLKVDPVTSAVFNKRAIVQTTQSDFQAGNAADPATISVTDPSGSASLAVSTRTDPTDVDFTQGSSTNVTVVNGKLQLANLNLPNNDFEFSLTGSWDVAGTGVCGPFGSQGSQGVTSADCPGVTPYSGSFMAVSCFPDPSPTSHVGTLKIVILDSNGVGLATQTLTTNAFSSSWSGSVVDTSQYFGQQVKLRFYLTNDGNSDWSSLTTSNYFIAGGQAAFHIARTCDGFRQLIFIDTVNGGPGGQYTSTPFQTSAHTPAFLSTNYALSIGFNALSVVLESASNPTGPWTLLGDANSVHPFLEPQSYFHYIASFGNTASNGTTLNTFNFTSRVSSGTFYSAILNPSNISSWGTFNSSIGSDGTHVFYVRSSTNPFSVLSSTPAWTAQTNNSNISVSTGGYFQVRDDIFTPSASKAPVLNDFTINWFQGLQPPPMASVVYDNRYWLSLDTGTVESKNSATLVLSKGPVWSVFDIKAGAFILWKNALYHADAAATGNVYLDNQGMNDNGAPINAYVTTKDYALDGLISDKVYRDVFIYADNLGPYSIYTNYVLDRGQSYSLATIQQNERTGMLVTRLNFPLDSTHQVFGRTIHFTFTQNDLDAPMRLLGGLLQYHTRPAL